MKEQILKFLRFLCGYIILSSVALLIFNGISSSKTYVYGWPSFILFILHYCILFYVFCILYLSSKQFFLLNTALHQV